MKRALLTGITGQDGSYLAELLIKKNYEVYGIKRRSSSLNTNRIDHIYEDPHNSNPKLKLIYGDLCDSNNITSIVKKVEPDEIYNLGAQSHVGVSFEIPEYTANVNALGTLRILEAIRSLGLADKTKFYQASSSELFGLVNEVPQNEKTPFYPRSPYAVSKLYSYWITINYREAYKIFACNGILFNHESPRRGETFVTRKITRGIVNISLGLEKCLYFGNLNARRDWGHAKDYVYMQWLMLQQNKPDDYVIATGEQYSVRQFIIWAAEAVGILIEFKGEGIDEIGVVVKKRGDISANVQIGQKIIKIDPKYFRPTEVENLLGDSLKAKKDLGWKFTRTAKDICIEMVNEDLKSARSNALILERGIH